MQEKRKLGFLVIISNINRGCIISAKQQLPYHAQIYTKAASMLDSSKCKFATLKNKIEFCENCSCRVPSAKTKS